MSNSKRTAPISQAITPVNASRVKRPYEPLTCSTGSQDELGTTMQRPHPARAKYLDCETKGEGPARRVLASTPRARARLVV